MLTVAQLLERWLSADQPWKPSTRIGYRSNARFLGTDPTPGGVRVVSLTPGDVRRVFERWERDGATVAVIAGRFRVLRSAVGWAYDERIIDHHPIRNMRGPGRAEPRRPLEDSAVQSLLRAGEERCSKRLRTTLALQRACGGGIERRRICSWFVWPRTPARAVVSSPRSSSRISKVGPCRSGAQCPAMQSRYRSPATRGPSTAPAGMAESAQAPSRGPTCGSCKKTRSTVTVAARTGRRWWRARTRVLAR
jgi:hypothetical protein